MTERLLRLQVEAESMVLKGFFEASRDAEEARDTEWLAAQHLQGIIKQESQSRRLAETCGAAESAQGILMGNKGRRMLDQLLADAEKRRRMEYFNSCATNIQRCWRGHRSRRLDEDSILRPDGLINNFRMRKVLLREIARKNEEFLAGAQATAADEACSDDKRKSDANEALHEAAARMHYLVSTEAQPGVFSASPPSPNSRRKACPVIVGNQPLEEVLKTSPVFKAKIREAIPQGVLPELPVKSPQQQPPSAVATSSAADKSKAKSRALTAGHGNTDNGKGDGHGRAASADVQMRALDLVGSPT